MPNKVKINNSHIYQRSKVIGQTAAPKLERQTGGYKESQLTRAKPSTGTKSTVGKPKLYLENCWRFTVESLKVNPPRGPSHQEALTLF